MGKKMRGGGGDGRRRGGDWGWGKVGKDLEQQ